MLSPLRRQALRGEARFGLSKPKRRGTKREAGWLGHRLGCWSRRLS